MWLRSHISFSRSYISNYSSYIEIITSQNSNSLNIIPFQGKKEKGKKGKKKKKKMEGKKKGPQQGLNRAS